jgi:hypothetical protein
VRTPQASIQNATPIQGEEARITRGQLLVRAGAASTGIAGLGLLLETLAAQAATMFGSAAQQLKNAMRKLWEEHITWTRLYIVSFASSERRVAVAVEVCGR